MNVDFDATDNFENCPPRADAMICSLRAFGYDLPMAIADLIDNSIYANSKNIHVDYGWNKGLPWVRISDDGIGMNLKKLKEAMRLGSQNPLLERDSKDLGRFGLGLKTASFSQCKLLTVVTKEFEEKSYVRFWDLDYVQKVKDWKIGTEALNGSKKFLEGIKQVESGTIVLWQKLDRVDLNAGDESKKNEMDFYNKFQAVVDYIEMVFHRYLEKSINIFVGRHKCKPWDPYLKSNIFTQKLESEIYQDKRVKITPYILPHISKRTEEENNRGSGLYGWNSHQGFYVYRNKRLIVPGGYLNFGLKSEEHYKLGRIAVDITNDMDHEWNIDVRKAFAIPPDNLQNDLARIARATRQAAMSIYRARTGKAKRKLQKKNDVDVWLKNRVRDKIVYKINNKHPVIERILDEINCKKSWIQKLFHTIESTIPHRLIIIDNTEDEDCHVDLPPDKFTPPESMLTLCSIFYRDSIRSGKSHNEAVDIITATEPFDSHPSYRALLDELKGDENAS